MPPEAGRCGRVTKRTRWIARSWCLPLVAYALLMTIGYLVFAVELFPEYLWVPSNGRISTLFWFVVGFFYLIPITVAAWNEPDPETEIEEGRYEDSLSDKGV